MTESMVQELLAKLEKLDAETYNNWCDEWYDMEGFDYSEDVALLKFPKRYLSILQGVIQDTCKAKKWHHDVCYNEETEKYVSLVVPADNETWLDSIEADTAAEALLKAYLKGLEAEAAR